MENHFRNSRGVTLVELLVVSAMMGLVVMSILGLYESTMHSASDQDEIVEVQQNLRIGLDQMVRDIRNAGFMIDKGSVNPFDTATNTTLTLNTAAVPARMARIVEDTTTTPPTTTYTSPASETTNLAITVALSDMVDFFEDGDWVRIIRPPDQSQPLNDAFLVNSKDRAARTITLQHFSTGGTDYQPGDVIVRVPNSGTNLPRTIAYSLSGDDLMRNDGTSTRAVANKITSVDFEYLIDNEWEENPAATDFDEITAVRITLQGATAALKSGVKTRQVRGVVNLRN